MKEVFPNEVLQQGRKMRPFHDLSFLLNQIHNYISIPDAIGDAADALTPFGTMTRYPNELTVEEHHAKQAIAFAEQILNWAASALQ